MPFEEITTVRFTGTPTAEDKFVIETSERTFIGGIGYDQPFSRERCLHRDHWPVEISDAVDELVIELASKYPEMIVTAESCHAWIRDYRQLFKDSPGFTIFIQFKQFRDQAKLVRFDGRILRICVFEASEPAT